MSDGVVNSIASFLFSLISFLSLAISNYFIYANYRFTMNNIRLALRYVGTHVMFNPFTDRLTDKMDKTAKRTCLFIIFLIVSLTSLT